MANYAQLPPGFVPLNQTPRRPTADVPPGFVPLDQMPPAAPSPLAAFLAPDAPGPASAPPPAAPTLDPLMADPAPAPVDQSTAVGDLRAGWLALQDLIPGFLMRGALQDTMEAQTDLAQGALPQREAQARVNMISPLEQQLAGVEAALATMSPRDPNRAAAEAAYLDLRRQVGQAREATGGADVAAAELAREAARRPETDLAAEAQLADAGQTLGGVLPGIIGRAAEQRAIPINPAADRAGNADTWGETFGALGDDPLGVARTFILRSLPSQGPTMLASILGQRVAGPFGAAVAGGATGATTEQSASLVDGVMAAMLQDKVDPLDEAAVQAWVAQNPDQVQAIIRKADTRASVIGAADAATGGLGGKLAEKVISSGAGTATRIGGVLAGGAVDAASEAGGEAAAQMATDGKIKPGDVLGEAIGSLGTGAPTTGGQMVAEAFRQNARPQPQPRRAFPADDQLVLQQGPLTLTPEQRVQPEDQATPTPPQEPLAQPDPAMDTPPAQPQAPTPDTTPAQPPAQIPAPDTPPDLPQGFVPMPAEPAQTDTPPAPQAAPTEQVGPPTTEQVEPVDVPADADPTPADPTPADVEQTPTVDELDQRVRDAQKRYDQAQRRNQAGEIPAEELQTARAEYSRAVEDWRAAVDAEKQAQQAATPEPQAETPAPEPVRGYAPAGELDAGHMTPDFAEGTSLPTKATGQTRPAVTNGKYTVYGPWALRNDALPPVNTKQETQSEAEAGISAGVVDRVIATAPDSLSAAQPVSWRVAVARDGTADAERVTGVLPDGGTIAVDGQTFGFLVNSRGYTLAAAPDGKVLGVYNDAGERIGVVQPTRTGAEAGLNYINALPEYDPRSRQPKGPQNPRAPKRAPDPNAPKKPRLDVKSIEAERQASLSKLDDAAREIQRRMQAGDTAPVTVALNTPSGHQTRFTFNADEKGLEAAKTTRKNWASKPAATLADAVPGRADDRADDRADVRTPVGGLTPRTEAVSFTERESHYQAAFADAGVDPVLAGTLPTEQQNNILVRVLENKFGFKINRATGQMKLRAIDVRAQLLDAHRNIQFMLHALGLPLEAISLNGRLTLSLERFVGRYLGSYNGATHTISMPGRSNSFAHEWGHALDHFLRDALTPASQAYLLSQVTRSEGLDPHQSVQAAYINLVHALFFDEADLALRMLALEQTAQKTDKHGNPTKGALDAQRQLDELRSGATRLRIAPTAYRASAAAYAPGSDYWTSVHEMLARAFEAYIAARVEAAGGTNEFITKGDQAYLSDADARLAMTFPKATDRQRIFDAFDVLFDHIRTQAILGPGAPAERPTADHITDPSKWQRAFAAQDQSVLTSLKKEVNAVRNAFTAFWNSPRNALRSGVSAIALNAGISSGRGLLDHLRALGQSVSYVLNSQRAFAKSMIAAQPKDAQPFLRRALEGTMTDPGTGRNDQDVTIEEHAERTVARMSTDITAAMKTLGLPPRLGKDRNDLLRRILYGERPSAPRELYELGDLLRKIMDKTYRAAVSAGITMGYVGQKGYLPRIPNLAAIEANRAKFETQAAKVYALQLDRNAPHMSVEDLIDLARATDLRADPLTPGKYKPQIQALQKAVKALQAKTPGVTKADVDKARADLVDAMRDDYAQGSAEDYRNRLISGEATDFATVGPTSSFKESRVLPNEADELLQDFYETDALDLVHAYVHRVSRRAAYQSYMGNSAGPSRLRSILTRQDVQDHIRGNPGKYNPNTPAGQLAILNDLANPKTDNIREMALNLAEEHGAKSEAIGLVRQTVETITGRSGAGQSLWSQRLAGTVYTIGTLRYLPRAAWSSLSEPVGFVTRTGDVKNAFRMFGLYVREAFRGMQSVKDLHALSSMIGVIATPLHDAILMNRLAGEYGDAVSGGVLVSRFFRANLLSQITNAQRRAGVAAGFYHMRDLARALTAPDARDAKRAILRAEFRDLGIKDAHIDHFAAWIKDKPGLPDLAEMETPEGKLFGNAAARLVDQVIQNPRRADKPALAFTPYGRVATGLLSFIASFTRNMITANVNRAGRNYGLSRDAGSSRGRAALDAVDDAILTRLGLGFAMIWAGQVIVAVPRALLFDAARWEEKGKEKDDDDDAWFDMLTPRQEWIARLAWSRSGAMGPLDVIYNAMTGLRYERDLTSLTAGAYIGGMLSDIQNMLGVRPGNDRNSPNTNTAERKAVKSAFTLFLAPAIAGAVSALPVAGPVGRAAQTVGLQGLTSATAADKVADWTVGPPNAKKR